MVDRRRDDEEEEEVVSKIEITDEILSLLRDQQACAVLSNALTLHVERCKRRLQRATTHKAKIRWAQEFKIAYEMRPGLLRKAQEAKSELESAIKTSRLESATPKCDAALGYHEAVLSRSKGEC